MGAWCGPHEVLIGTLGLNVYQFFHFLAGYTAGALMAKKATILIVDKERILVDLLIRTLTSPELSVIGTTSAEEGGRLADLHGPDVLVIDPSIQNGISLVSHVRSSPVKAKVVAIAGSDEIRDRVRELNVETIVNRDAGLDALVAGIGAALPSNLKLPGQDKRTGVLVCDDQDEIRAVLAEFLTSRGYKVTTAKNGLDALELLESTPGIEVVLLDVSMPVMGGMETLSQIMSRDPHTNVLMMTAVADSEIARQALKIGAFDYVVKPFDFVAIEGIIAACLSHSEYKKQSWWKRLTRG